MRTESTDKNPKSSALTFDEFPESVYQMWRNEVEKLLEGASFEKKMVTDTYEGVNLRPIYNREDIRNLPTINSFPGISPFIRSQNAFGYWQKPWEIAQKIPCPTPSEFNKAIVDDLNQGQTAIAMKLDQAARHGKDPDKSEKGEIGRNGTSISSITDLDIAFKEIDLDKIPVHMKLGASSLPFASLIFALARKRGLKPESVAGSLKCDPIGELAVNGELYISPAAAFDELAALTKWASENQSKLKIIAVDASIYHNCGSGAVEELAFALATGLEYIRALRERGISIDDSASSTLFEFAIGSNFFGQIAKLRAARMLWSKIVSSCGGNDESQKMHIHAKTSYYDKTSYDPHVNMLRTTTEALAAILGGCDSLQVGFFDETIKRPDEFSRRFARNIQIILREESHIDKIIDPAGGSWCIENLTDQYAKEAWNLFQEIESRGGMLKALEDGFPQKTVEATAAKREKNIAMRKDVYVGTTIYADPDEPAIESASRDYESIYNQRMNDLEKHRQGIDQNAKSSALETLHQESEKTSNKIFDKAIEAALAGATLGEIGRAIHPDRAPDIEIYPLRITRGVEMFEVLRRAVEEHRHWKSKSARVFLACFGNLSDYKARGDFAAGFFVAGGFEVKSGIAKDDGRIIKEILESGAQIAVICSGDKNYAKIVPRFARAIKEKKPDIILILAGDPKNQAEFYKESRIDEFIFAGVNVYELLMRLARKIGVIS